MNQGFRSGAIGQQLPLIGRERELQLLREALDAAQRGHGGIALIGGEAGIGKSALAAAMCRESGAGIVLAGHCYELSATPPYGPWVELFSRYRPEANQPSVPEAFARSGTIGTVTSQTALARDVLEFFERLTRPGVTYGPPAVLVLEDLHWADPASLELLRLIVRELADLSMLLLTTYRTDELTSDHRLARLLPVLGREGPSTHIELQRLASRDIEVLVRSKYSLTKEDRLRLVSHLYDRASGNPFFTIELLRTLEEGHVIGRHEQLWRLGDLNRAPIPLLVRQVIEGRLARIDHDARQHLALAAIIGQEIPLGLWTLLSSGTDDLRRTIERATAAHLLEESSDGSGLRFVHALIRETLYAGTPLPRRQSWHRQAAEALSAELNPDPDAVASHFRRARDDRAATWLIRAGDRAQQAFAWITAIDRYQAALDLLEARAEDIDTRVWLYCVLGLLHRYTDPERGVRFIETGDRLATRTDDPVLKAMTLYFQGHVRGFTGDGIRTYDQQSRGLAALDALDPVDRERLDTMLASGSLAREYNPWASASVTMTLFGRYGEAERIIRRLRSNEAKLGEREQVRNAVAHRALCEIHSAYGRLDEARRVAERARSYFRELDHQAMLGNVLMIELLYVVLPYLADDLAARQATADAAVRAWTLASGTVTDLEFSPRSAILPLLILNGDWDAAEALGATMLRLGWFLDTFAGQIAGLARWRGNTSQAWQIINRFMLHGPLTAPGSVQFHLALELQRIAAELLISDGELGTAQAWLKAHDDWLAWNGAVLGRAEGRLSWATWHRASGSIDRAIEHAQTGLACASDPRQPVALIAAHRLLGALHTDLNDFELANNHLQSALALAKACAAPYESARTHLALARLSQARSIPDAASEHVSVALAICEQLGAEPLANRITANCPTADPAIDDHSSMITPREVEVLRLIAQGFDNTAIADQLHISPHTVHRHVANILAKVDVPTRGAAVAWALRRDLLGPDL